MKRDLHSVVAQAQTLEGARQVLLDGITEHAALTEALECVWEQRDTAVVDAVEVAALLSALSADAPTRLAGLYLHRPESAPACAQALLRNIASLDELREEPCSRDQVQTERLRQLLLATVEDARAVLVVLARETRRLYHQRKSADARRLALDVMDLYAPLANRLGVASLKWELEDLAFQVLEPEQYQRIAKALEERREDRERYIDEFIRVLHHKLGSAGIEGFDLKGRPKHLYSIWKKMVRKRVGFDELFDVRAVRVLVDSLPQCYGVLGVVHGAWLPIRAEFDDYVANPKDNGYQSLHTAVIGPSGKPVEVQIRTRTMDADAELGVAAHWQYKEGGGANAMQRGINNLRNLLENGVDSEPESFQEAFAERVLVLTPQGDIVDLVQGATPLDFAYAVHTEIGHRCRGAKVNGEIVPLTRRLLNGERVEILTANTARPSRDWLSRDAGYLASSRARHKVRHWFNLRDHATHLNDGRDILARELRRLNARGLAQDDIAKQLKFETLNDLYIALGRGEAGAAHIANAVEQLLRQNAPSAAPLRIVPSREQGSQNVQVMGVDQLLVSVASCCQPVPFDAIIGFITRGRGVKVHRRDCINILNLPEAERARLLDVDWGEQSTERYSARLRLGAYDRSGLLRDVSNALTKLHVNILELHTVSDRETLTACMRLSVEVRDAEHLQRVMASLAQLPNVYDVLRDT